MITIIERYNNYNAANKRKYLAEIQKLDLSLYQQDIVTILDIIEDINSRRPDTDQVVGMNDNLKNWLDNTDWGSAFVVNSGAKPFKNIGEMRDNLQYLFSGLAMRPTIYEMFNLYLLKHPQLLESGKTNIPNIIPDENMRQYLGWTEQFSRSRLRSMIDQNILYIVEGKQQLEDEEVVREFKNEQDIVAQTVQFNKQKQKW